MLCENCSNIHDGNYGSGRFCSKFCSSSFSSNKNKELKNKKISESLKGRFTGLESSTYKSNRFKRMMKKRIEKAEADIKKGNFTSIEDLEKESENW